MADYIQKFKPGHAVTFTASAAVLAGRLVAVTGDRTVGPAGADSAAVVGIAATDAASNETTTVFVRHGVHDVVAAGEVAVGAAVASAAAGKVAASGTNKIGIALTGAAEDGDVITVLFI